MQYCKGCGSSPKCRTKQECRQRRSWLRRREQTLTFEELRSMFMSKLCDEAWATHQGVRWHEKWPILFVMRELGMCVEPDVSA